MRTGSDDKHEHISDDRLVEISTSTADEFSEAERMHVANCDRCRRLLGALFRLQTGQLVGEPIKNCETNTTDQLKFAAESPHGQ